MTITQYYLYILSLRKDVIHLERDEDSHWSHFSTNVTSLRDEVAIKESLTAAT